ncbi:ribokinase [Acidiphilium acidophilum]|uniref:Ribokinase n=1 Tax=Acidiphilium acidophilum TaxID=76588 RepID=A0AAW9DNS1_ACIAO|nr:ribokinase [Acidiphilium acidophilum]MDX5930375.1 ribokinase [Acidiphilium acidophilum]GBQ06843.1 ribokinase family sugar kinase [Acidiphilium acidophilum DSM 700]
MIVLGSANMDIVVRTERAPHAGETLLGHDYALYPGGKGANQAVAARRAGAEVRFIGCLGRDSYGDKLYQTLAAEGIDAKAIIRTAIPTGVAIITVEGTGENRIIVIPGANHALTPADLPETFPSGTILLAQLEIPIPVVLAAAAANRAAGGTTILNVSPVAGVDPATLAALRDAADILLVNEAEASCLLASDHLASPEAAAIDLAADRRAAIVTLGAAGVVWAANNATSVVPGHLPCHPVTVIDTTGCGDAFAGAFAAAIERGAPIQSAVAFGNAAGALAATRHGAQPAMPRADEIAALLEP